MTELQAAIETMVQEMDGIRKSIREASDNPRAVDAAFEVFHSGCTTFATIVEHELSLIRGKNQPAPIRRGSHHHRFKSKRFRE